ncbi:hypothetical protein GGTG_07446 [Gaeumannomyces tritici R3-111a-1]|uniref:Zn(2)-C6 fungal-type domain-containing protein n=1 Tax=Gaeumannomyces tritici (strain R3-111a-1) TaxID=644352 RepID=J3P1P8_GAET3|nr:hypothetical protein GGTG_07446 [Gaeumannomyces tritici R3-111a-1]EJT73590.1 hypothetical protein GGTG_07446 [Gaeumannomyces tritici R3-111a-1]
MGVAKACSQCRARKGKRIAPVDDGPHACAPCTRRGILFSFVARGTASRPRLLAAADSTSQSSSPSVTSNSGASTVAPGLNLSLASQLELVQLYLQLIHDKPHTLFHPTSLLQQVRDGAVPATRFVEAVKAALNAVMEAMSLANVHAAILLRNLCGAHGRPDAEMPYFGIALRIAQIIRLPASAASDGPIECLLKGTHLPPTLFHTPDLAFEAEWFS